MLFTGRHDLPACFMWLFVTHIVLRSPRRFCDSFIISILFTVHPIMQ